MPPTSQRPLKPERELRIVASDLRVERRAEGDGPAKIVGHAAVFDAWTTLYEGRYWTLKEVIRPGAFRNALTEKQDVVALFNHDPNHVLGRSSAGTLSLREDGSGLLSEIEPPDTQLGRDLVALVSRGDLKGMSFAFRVRPSGEKIVTTTQDEKETDERELLDLDLFDVSVVTYPAYDQTDVGLRSSGIEARALEKDRPHVRPAPKREEFRRWLESAQR